MSMTRRSLIASLPALLGTNLLVVGALNRTVRSSEHSAKSSAANRAEFPFNEGVPNVEGPIVGSRISFLNCGGPKEGIEAYYVNATVPSNNGIEVPGSDAITMCSELIFGDGSRRSGLAVQGEELTLAPGEGGWFSWPDVTLEARETYFVVTWILNGGGRPVPRNYQINAERGEALGGGSGARESIEMRGMTGSYGYGPTAVLGGSGTPDSVALIADSIGMGAAESRDHGTGSGQRGFLGRALDEMDIPCLKLGAHGATIASFFDDAFALRRPLLDNAGAVILQVGNNDLGSAPDEVETLWNRLCDQIKAIVPGPILGVVPGPRTRSSDEWATLAGQSNAPVAGDTRTRLRAHIHSSVGGRLVGVIDPLPVWTDTSTGSELWIPGMTLDGTHPSERAHIEAASLLTSDSAIARYLRV